MATATHMSLDEFLALKPGEPEIELMDGAVYQKPVLGKGHSQIAGELPFSPRAMSAKGAMPTWTSIGATAGCSSRMSR